ncbi:MAG: phage portal protein [Phycisphaerales bacterium]|nr:MAG: phage portal protein [Phycisphaerales bacterium]
MSYELAPFASIPLDDALLEALIAEHEAIRKPRLMRLWSYYRNALAEPNARGGSLGAPAQVAGLPPRLNGDNGGGSTNGNGDGENGGEEEANGGSAVNPEIVIENDIAWRIHTLVDFMFPDSPRLISRAADPTRAAQIEAILQSVINANGGTALWQDAALLGSVYGHVDFLLGCDPLLQRVNAGRSGPDVSASHLNEPTSPTGAIVNRPGAVPSNPSADELVNRIGSMISIETVEAPRAIPLLNRSDYRLLDAYIIRFDQAIHDVDHGGWLSRLSNAIRRAGHRHTRRKTVEITEIHSATHCQRYEDGILVEETINRLGRIPVVHIQNLSQPLHYTGLSDVEPLIPLQDELNTRLSDRANRVTMQSFRMWLGKGIDNFTDHPVGPGQMWFTDNIDASIESFGGDADSPSEKAHIEEIREALDKASGVTPAAAGHIRARVGNLTSENALRISLMGTIAKTKRKRVTYGRGIAALCELILHALHVSGVFRTAPSERGVETTWADPIASDESRRIADALAKAQLGVPTSLLRAELGYPDSDAAS